MTSGNERSRRVAASFTRAYYTALLQKPEMLSVFYTVDATFEHLGCKAQGSADIQAAVNNLYIPRPEAEVKISSIATTLTGDHTIFATIKGTMLSAATTTNANVTFTHEVELMEYAAHPGSFGIVSDRREEAAAVREEAPSRWAYETPPMFAQEPGPDAMEPIEQPPAATAEGPAADDAAEGPTAPALSPAAAAAAAAAAGGGGGATEEAQPAEPSADAVQAEPAAAEEKRPRSFAEALKMTKRSSGPAATVTVVAKDTTAAATAAAAAAQVPAAQPRERRDPAAAAADRDAKAPHKDAAQGNGRRAAGNNDGGERRNGAANANGNAAKPKKDAEGRALSRTVVFFDIIVKGLPANVTKQYVQDLVQPSAPVKEVKIVSQADKKDPSVVRTFAFAQLDHEAIKESGSDVKAKIAMIIEANKTRKGPNGQRIQVDEVREKYTAAPVTASTEATTA